MSLGRRILSASTPSASQEMKEWLNMQGLACSSVKAGPIWMTSLNTWQQQWNGLHSPGRPASLGILHLWPWFCVTANVHIKIFLLLRIDGPNLG